MLSAVRRIYVLDDDTVMLATVRRMLERAGLSATTFDSPGRFLLEAVLEAPCCVVLDLQMPDTSGLEVQEELQRRAAFISVVFMSARGDVPSSVRAMKAGAIDFLPKPFAPQELVAAVEAGLASSAARAAAEEKRLGARSRLAGLTPREREVADLLAAGLRNAEIGSRLGAREKTIKVHRARLLKKLGLRSPAELVTLLIEAGEAPAGGGGS